MLFVRPGPGGNRSKLNGFGSSTRGPGPRAQGKRLDLKFGLLSSALERSALAVSESMTGWEPELVIVLEVNSSVEQFARAARQVDGLEYLAEMSEGEVDVPDGFESDKSGRVNRTLYVLGQNSKALTEMVRLWELWKANRRVKLDLGLAPWKQVFELLNDVRPWGPQDRINDTGIVEAWAEDLAAGAENVNAEIELWFRGTPSTRKQAEGELRDKLTLTGGIVLDVAEIPEIAYHALLVRFPRVAANSILATEGEVVHSARVARIRPQSLVRLESEIGHSESAEVLPSPSVSQASPLVAVLDGVPLTGHARLRTRVALDDPEGLDSVVEAKSRLHGTAITSLVVWGDLQVNGSPLDRAVLAHPIFSTSTTASGVEVDSMRNDRLPVNVTKAILDRLLVGTKSLPALASTIRVIVIAAGHLAQPFGRSISPWARLLDHYAHRFNILFVVSAGNYDAPIYIETDDADLLVADSDQLQSAVRRKVFDDAHERRVLAPADSMNALTVGAAHADAMDTAPSANALDPIGSSNLPSPFSAVGGGYKRQMKPELFAPGGRVHFRQRLDAPEGLVLDPIRSGVNAPGPRAAVPGLAGSSTAEGAIQGTSAAAALVGHEAGQLAELLDNPDNSFVDARMIGVAAKALIINSGSWMGADQLLADARGTDGMHVRREASRLLGFGTMQADRIAFCSPERVTVLGTGTMFSESSRLLEFPVPADLNGRKILRRATLTLSWFSPTNPRHLTYRQGRVWFEVENAKAFGFASVEGEFHAVRRGSTQHEVLEAEKAITVSPTAALNIRVSCMREATQETLSFPYAIAVTFEVAEGSGVRVYEQVRQGLQARTTIETSRVRVR